MSTSRKATTFCLLTLGQAASYAVKVGKWGIISYLAVILATLLGTLAWVVVMGLMAVAIIVIFVAMVCCLFGAFYEFFKTGLQMAFKREENEVAEANA